MKILAADIGATNSRFGAFDAGADGSLSLGEVRWLSTQNADSFQGLLLHLSEGGFSLKPQDADMAVFAVAGPVQDGVRSSPPFIPWDIDITRSAQTVGCGECRLINDFVAQAYACISEVGKKAETVIAGQSKPQASIAVIGAGTGLGKAVLVNNGGTYIAVPSEGGHADFPFESPEEFEFNTFLLRETGDTYATGNKVVSGSGLGLLHRFLTGEDLAPAEVGRNIKKFERTLVLAARFYGRACRNFALETLSLGGLFIAGGVAAHTPEIVYHEEFRNEFRRSDTLASLLGEIPVSLITNQDSGLWGGAVFGLQELRRRTKAR